MGSGVIPYYLLLRHFRSRDGTGVVNGDFEFLGAALENVQAGHKKYIICYANAIHLICDPLAQHLEGPLVRSLKELAVI